MIYEVTHLNKVYYRSTLEAVLNLIERFFPDKVTWSIIDHG